ncbi:MAG: TonB-dependent receptor [Ferruginibacter sp.]
MKMLLLFTALLVGTLTKGQIKVSGKITDTRNKPLQGASITIKNTYDGATTDSLGFFSITTDEKGEQIIEVTISGYKTAEQKINLSGQPITLSFSLKEQVTELRAVVITAGAFEASDKKKGATLSALDIVTTASANADITGALKTLPGTQQVGESEGLFVRGGTATESKIYMDGNLVNNFFYSSVPGIASRGRFNPFLFKGTVFSAGGYSALYGQALSSALILESNDLPEKSEADISLSVIGLGGGLQHLAKDKKSSWGFTYNFTHLGLAYKVLKQKPDYYQVPMFHEGDGNFRIKTKKGFIKYYGYWSASRIGLRSNDIDSLLLKNAFSLKNVNTYQNVNWKERLANNWNFFTSISYSTNKDDISNELQDANNQKLQINNQPLYAFKNYSLLSKGQYAEARMIFEKRLRGLSAIRFGSDYFYSKEKSTFTLYDGTSFSETVKNNLAAGFAEADIYLTNYVALKVGARAEHSQLMDQWNAAPRISLAYKFRNNGQASFAYGIFYQDPERKYLPAAVPDLGFAKATHYILQYQRIVPAGYTFRTELFYKKYNNLFKTSLNSNGREVASSNNGSGDAKGFELFWRDKKTFKFIDYWISYSYLDTKRNFLNYPASIAPPFAAKHTASLVLKTFILPWKTGFNASYTFASGRPYYRIVYNNGSNKYEITDAGTTASYNNLGFSVNYLPNLGNKKAKMFSVVVLSISNVPGFNQVFSYNYNYNGTYKEPVTPPAKRFIYLGWFINIGTDRTQDAINNNL